LDHSIEYEEAWRRAYTVAMYTEKEKCIKKLQHDFSAEKVKDLKHTMNVVSVSAKNVYLPIYSLAYTYDTKQYTVVVSGQTGSIKGQRPYGLGNLGSIGKAGLEIVGNIFFRTSKN